MCLVYQLSLIDHCYRPYIDLIGEAKPMCSFVGINLHLHLFLLNALCNMDSWILHCSIYDALVLKFFLNYFVLVLTKL